MAIGPSRPTLTSHRAVTSAVSFMCLCCHILSFSSATAVICFYLRPVLQSYQGRHIAHQLTGQSWYRAHCVPFAAVLRGAAHFEPPNQATLVPCPLCAYPAVLRGAASAPGAAAGRLRAVAPGGAAVGRTARHVPGHAGGDSAQVGSQDGGAQRCLPQQGNVPSYLCWRACTLALPGVKTRLRPRLKPPSPVQGVLVPCFTLCPPPCPP